MFLWIILCLLFFLIKSHADCYCALYCCLTPLQRQIQISQRQPVFVDLFISELYNNLVSEVGTLGWWTFWGQDCSESSSQKEAPKIPFTFLSSKHVQVKLWKTWNDNDTICNVLSNPTVLNLTFWPGRSILLRFWYSFERLLSRHAVQ